MEDLVNVVFGRFIVRFLGGNTRYCLLKLFGFKPEYSSVMNSGKRFSWSADFYNAVFGFATLLLIVFGGGLLL